MSGLNSLEARTDRKCKANSVKKISRKICRNNCSQWNHKESRCMRGYTGK